MAHKRRMSISALCRQHLYSCNFESSLSAYPMQYTHRQTDRQTAGQRYRAKPPVGGGC